jgi:stage II sporulation protein AA (anti-sigma F factor antagonist)
VLKFEASRETLIVRVIGEMDLYSADWFRSEIDRKIEEVQPLNILFDLGDVSFIDSSGLGVILGRYKSVTQRGGKMAITKAQPTVRRILELSGLMRVMGIYRDEPGALDDLSKGGR